MLKCTLYQSFGSILVKRPYRGSGKAFYYVDNGVTGRVALTVLSGGGGYGTMTGSTNHADSK